MTAKYKLEVITDKGILLFKIETTSKSLLQGFLELIDDEGALR